MFAEKIDGWAANGVLEDLARDITRCEFLFPATSFIGINQTCGEKLRLSYRSTMRLVRVASELAGQDDKSAACR